MESRDQFVVDDLPVATVGADGLRGAGRSAKDLAPALVMSPVVQRNHIRMGTGNGADLRIEVDGQGTHFLQFLVARTAACDEEEKVVWGLEQRNAIIWLSGLSEPIPRQGAPPSCGCAGGWGTERHEGVSQRRRHFI